MAIEGESYDLIVLSDGNAVGTEKYGARTIRSDDELWPHHLLWLPRAGASVAEQTAHAALWLAQNQVG